MEIQYTRDYLLTCETESYSPWPNFKPNQTIQLGGLWRSVHLYHVLTAADLSCAAWRAAIPSNILRTLQQFSECHAELIEMAQVVPDFYLNTVRKSPALTLLYATYWIYHSIEEAPSIDERMIVWENLDSQNLLQHMRFNASKSFIRALSKIPIADATHYLIRAIRDHWQVPDKRRLLQHRDSIKIENAWLLSCYPAILDPGIHQLAAEAPNYEEYTAVDVVCDLSSRRELHGWEPWPYRNMILTWEQLLRAYNNFFKKTNHFPETFPKPPVYGVTDENYHIEALTNLTALKRESREMANCTEDYAGPIAYGKSYAYRLLIPERATVMLEYRSGRWGIEEAMISENLRAVLPSTWIQLRKWLKGNSELKNSSKLKLNNYE